MVPPSGTNGPGQAARGLPASPGRAGPWDRPASRWRRATDLMYAVRRTYCTVTTVQHYPGISQCRGLAAELTGGRRARLVIMTAHATGDRQDPPAEQPRAAAAAVEPALNPLQRLIQQRLRERGWSYGEVAKRGGLPRSTLYTLATTRNLARPPRPATIDALAKGLDVPVSAVRAAAAESTGLHYYDEAPAGQEHPGDRERELLIASIDELTAEDRRHVAALVESLRNRTSQEPADR